MRSGWYERLIEAIENRKGSMRALSKDSGLGENFISQMKKDGKKPAAENVFSILSNFTDAEAMYVLLDIHVDERGLTLLRQFGSLPVASQDAFEVFLRSLQAGPNSPEPPFDR